MKKDVLEFIQIPDLSLSLKRPSRPFLKNYTLTNFSQVESRLPHDGVDDSWLLGLKNIGATLTEQRLGVQPPEDVKMTSKGPKVNNQPLPVNLSLILRAVQSLSPNIPTIISSLQFGLESLQKKVEDN